MANYTIELRNIVESGVQIFDFPYNFYNEDKRKEFEDKFIKHFYFREIGFETVDRFKWYLMDKMLTVFPYYNELFKSASIEYDVLDNYKLTETYTRNVENSNKQSGISSSVGQALTDQQGEAKGTKNSNITGAVNRVEAVNGNDTGETTTTTEGASNTTNNETVNGNSTKQSEGSSTNTTTTDIKKLDTPQGLVNLTDTRYVTEAEQSKVNGTQSNEATETSTDKKTTSGTSETKTTGSTETSSKNVTTRRNEIEEDTSSQESGTDLTTSFSKTEQKTTADSNTRLYADGQQNETYTLTRRGNIGVDTDSDAIEKHNRLQKTLRNIERMFFEECNDLFMLVY